MEPMGSKDLIRSLLVVNPQQRLSLKRLAGPVFFGCWGFRGLGFRGLGFRA